MKTMILLFSSIMILNSCDVDVDQDEDSKQEHQAEESIHGISEGDVEILEIDGCQYIVYKEVHGSNKAFGYMAHKGNCSNPVHGYNLTLPADSLSNGS